MGPLLDGKFSCDTLNICGVVARHNSEAAIPSKSDVRMDEFSLLLAPSLTEVVALFSYAIMPPTSPALIDTSVGLMDGPLNMLGKEGG